MLCKSEKFCPPPRFSLAVFFETPNTILESRSCASLLSQQPKRQDCHPRPPLLDSPTLIFFASSSVTLPVLCPPPSNSNMHLSDILGMEQNQISIFRNVSNILPSHPTIVTTLKTVFNKGNKGKVSLHVPSFNKDIHTYNYFFF